jgi:hypothetical protein
MESIVEDKDAVISSKLLSRIVMVGFPCHTFAFIFSYVCHDMIAYNSGYDGVVDQQQLLMSNFLSTKSIYQSNTFTLLC